jgi:ribonuclease HII
MIIAGVDEVGVGCLAGPVVASCVILPEQINEIFKDSKSTSESLRSKQFQFLRRNTYASIGLCTPQEIDEMNILNATHLAMKRAINNIQIKPEKILIDGKYIPSGLLNAEAFIGGDKVHQQISAASIYAKYFRDNLMGQYAQIFPKYYFEKNKGYPTQMHKEAIIEFGLSKIHRKSFKMK